MGFNFNAKNDYALNTSLIEEAIRLYGVQVKFLVTTKVNSDDVVFGDFSHMKSDSSMIYDMYMLPEQSDGWDSSSYNFTPYGFTNYDNVSLFVARSAFTSPAPSDFSDIIGNLLVFPNNKVMEIVDIGITTPGINNLFTYDNAKAAYKLTAKPYNFKIIDELNRSDIAADPTAPNTTLDTYFAELIAAGTAQDTAAEVTANTPTVVKTAGAIDTTVDKPDVDTTTDNAWGKW